MFHSTFNMEMFATGTFFIFKCVTAQDFYLSKVYSMVCLAKLLPKSLVDLTLSDQVKLRNLKILTLACALLPAGTNKVFFASSVSLPEQHIRRCTLVTL